ncbi:MAG TPA: isovaleryl-CoA dehydrogenase [Gammaproteobacteria bacterium]|nr:isovaleryl-CoA dehydrogenase [Gammaproteobacteria bacterium]
MMSELQWFRDEVRAFCEQNVAPLAKQIDEEDNIPRSLWNALGDAGLLGITIPEKYGGRNLGYLAHIIAVEELSRASGTVGFAYADHSNICLNNLYIHGTEDQRERYVRKLCSGEFIGALSMSEPDAGSDVVGSMKCHAEKKSDHWLASGTKKWCTNGNCADVIIVYMRTADVSAGAHCMTAFLLDNTIENWQRGEKENKLGMRGADNCELYFDNTQIPLNNQLGEENEGVKVLMSGLDTERLLLAAGPVGIMQSAMDLVLPYVRERKQFGKPVGQFELMQAKLAKMYTALQTARAFVYKTAMEFDQGNISRINAASCAYYASHVGVKVALEAIQSLGGIGYMNHCDAGRFLRDIKIYEIGGGTNEIRQMLIGRELFNADPEWY